MLSSETERAKQAVRGLVEPFEGDRRTEFPSCDLLGLRFTAADSFRLGVRTKTSCEQKVARALETARPEISPDVTPTYFEVEEAIVSE